MTRSTRIAIGCWLAVSIGLAGCIESVRTERTQVAPVKLTLVQMESRNTSASSGQGRGTITVRIGRDIKAERNATIIIFPSEPPETPYELESLANTPKTQIVLNTIRQKGGAYARTSKQGQFEAKLPAGKYYFLCVSERVRLTGLTKQDEEKFLKINNHLKDSKELIGSSDFHWQTLELPDDDMDHQFVQVERMEYSPYKTRIWIALDDSPHLTPRLFNQIRRQVGWYADRVDLSSWRVSVEPAPSRWHAEILARLGEIEIADETPESDDIVQGDKLVIVRIKLTPFGYLIQARGLDCHFRQWVPMVEKTTWQAQQIPREVFDAARESFLPLVSIERVEGRTASVRVKAGGLALRKNSPAYVAENAVLRAVMRKNDRIGNLRKGGVETVEWTLLLVKERQGTRLECEIHTGIRGVLSGRSSPRIERAALVARPTHPSTFLRVESNDLRAPYALPGYQLYARHIGSEESEYLGLTDWQGGFHVEPHETSPIRTLYIKSGAVLLARLPLLPGLEKELIASVRDDDHRLGAEAIVTGLENNFMDLVARRQVLASNIRDLIEQKEFEKAEEELKEFRKIPDRIAYVKLVNDQSLGLVTQDRRTQEKIRLMFSDLHGLLGNFLEPQLANQLYQEIQNARKKGAKK